MMAHDNNLTLLEQCTFYTEPAAQQWNCKPGEESNKKSSKHQINVFQHRETKYKTKIK